jgi:hypothetical protein
MRRTTAVFLLLMAGTTGLHAQAALTPGSRVRVVQPTPTNRTVAVGRLVTSWGDSVQLADDAGAMATVYVGRARRLEVSLGRQRRTGQGAMSGLLIGGGIGAVLGAATWQPCPPDAWLCFSPDNRAQAAVLGGVLIGVPGMLIGAIAGSGNRERWERVRVVPQIGVTPSANGVTVGARLAF